MVQSVERPSDTELDPSAEGVSDDDTPETASELSDPKFDRWLESELQAEFGAVASEPIPAGLLSLIESHRRKR